MNDTGATDSAELNAPYRLAPADVEAFRQDGHVRLRKVFSAAFIARRADLFARLVDPRRSTLKPLEQRSTYQKAFVQVMNLWRRDGEAKAFVFGERLARIAAELMAVSGVRLYHDQALFKEPYGGRTPWHADQYYWPFDSDRTITAWVPLQETPLEMGPVAFARGSHRLEIGRDLPISDESEARMGEALAGVAVDETAFEAGDVSFHGGWTFHRASPNTTDRMRGAMTVIYMDENIRLAGRLTPAKQFDAQTWVPGVKVGEIAASAINPVLWSCRS